MFLWTTSVFLAISGREANRASQQNQTDLYTNQKGPPL